ncbi:uncharacterized protein Z519_07356 [Cladophialophora bantiana CBS 173.52]|uniref:GRF-type domain-containing protein n=1 Tax=Cladophialophora bantiana (strain ATCC 10958 / CBS 173.52 / CDC B-1940 / NIH 8579) TaxID=1442370 RepID=A0A0D2G0V4_CLAB1|nr:uncharacterized protein Z519_07356 [Cladophialophora bantiana CBS 173.52]KIW92372.1 hypothetical protein Z519_07356 [Cladophialophora bantiana CBS 173.52]
MANSYTTRNGCTSKRGAFLDGIWHCDCDPRLPADKFQVKKKCKNHGRWFYTCQKPRPERCDFFIWNDDAKIREEAAVLSNSRSEPIAPILHTPQKKDPSALPPTPQTGPNNINRQQTKEPVHFKHEESFEWSSSNDEELIKAEQDMLEKTPFQTPKKAPRTGTLTSPGKSTFVQAADEAVPASEAWPLSDDIFTTPTTTYQFAGGGLLSPSSTQVKRAAQHMLPETEPSTLASEALNILRNSQISSQVERELVDLLNKHDLRTQGIIKGRDITRLAVQVKDKKIAELQARISALEAEKETNKRVISHLKHDMAASPKKDKGRSTRRGQRPEA